MLAEERRRRLLVALSQNGSLTVAQAGRDLGVSRMTVHRDLDTLSADGLIRKVHGGAMAVPQPDEDAEPWARPFHQRLAAATKAKKAIARHLIRLTDGARTLILDASSTAYAFGQCLPRDAGAEGLFLTSGGLPLFNLLVRRRDGLRVALTGGEPHPRTGSLVGPLALASLGEMRFDFAIFSCVGLMTYEGVAYDATPEEAEIKRAYLAHSRKAVLALDSSKLDFSAPYRLADVSAFFAVVTEEGQFEPKKGALRPKR